MYYTARNKYSRNELHISLKNILIVISIVILLLLIIVLTTTGSRPQKYVEIRVEKGQSLWNIVTSYYNSEINIRKKIYQIKKINHLESVLLQPEQKLKIPLE